jgi:hypothetical protein
MFRHITQNWRAMPLASLYVVIALIANTTTKKGLSIRCDLDPFYFYPKGIKISDAKMATLNITLNLGLSKILRVVMIKHFCTQIQHWLRSLVRGMGRVPCRDQSERGCRFAELAPTDFPKAFEETPVFRMARRLNGRVGQGSCAHPHAFGAGLKVSVAAKRPPCAPSKPVIHSSARSESPLSILVVG